MRVFIAAAAQAPVAAAQSHDDPPFSTRCASTSAATTVAPNSASDSKVLDRNTAQAVEAAAATMNRASVGVAPRWRSHVTESVSHSATDASGTSLSQGRFAGKVGYARHTIDSSAGNSTGYLVWGIGVGRLLIW